MGRRKGSRRKGKDQQQRRAELANLQRKVWHALGGGSSLASRLSSRSMDELLSAEEVARSKLMQSPAGRAYLHGELDVNARMTEGSWKGQRIVHVVASSDSLHRLQLLLHLAPRVDVRDRWGNLPLHRVLSKKSGGYYNYRRRRVRAACCKLLIYASVGLLDEPNKDGVIPLDWAVTRGHLSDVQQLLEAGANPMKSGVLRDALPGLKDDAAGQSAREEAVDTILLHCARWTLIYGVAEAHRRDRHEAGQTRGWSALTRFRLSSMCDVNVLRIVFSFLGASVLPRAEIELFLQDVGVPPPWRAGDADPAAASAP